MAQDTAELVVASYGNVYIAPVGTDLPDDPTESLDSAFVQLGLISDDGVTLGVDPTIESFMAWQRRQAVRRELTGQQVQLTFALEQWNEDTVLFAYGGGTVEETSPGVFHYAFPEDTDALAQNALVLDWQDGDRKYRLVAPEGQVTENVESKFARDGLALLPITFMVNSPPTGGHPADIYAADAAFHS